MRDLFYRNTSTHTHTDTYIYLPSKPAKCHGESGRTARAPGIFRSDFPLLCPTRAESADRISGPDTREIREIRLVSASPSLFLGGGLKSRGVLLEARGTFPRSLLRSQINQSGRKGMSAPASERIVDGMREAFSPVIG